MFAETKNKYPIFKRASNPAITYTNLENKSCEKENQFKKPSHPTLGLLKPEMPHHTETRRTTKEDTNRVDEKIIFRLPTKQTNRRNSSNVSSDIGNDISIREFQNKDHMNERFPSDFIYMDIDLLETKKSDLNDGQERQNYVGQRILPLSLSSPVQHNHPSMNFSNSFCRDILITQSNGESQFDGVKKALYKHFYFDKVAQLSPSYRSYVFADKSDHISDIPDVKEWNVYDQSDSSLINFVTYMENSDRENIPSTPREQEKPIEIRESIEPKQSYFSNNVPKQSELSYFLSNESETLGSPMNFRISNIQSDIKNDNYSNTNLFGNTTTVSKKTSEKGSERASFSRTPGRVSEFMISPGDRHRIFLPNKLEEVRENTKEYETNETKKPKIRAKFKMNPHQLSKIMGKDLSISNKSITMFYQTDEPSRDNFNFEEFKDFNTQVHKESFDTKNSLPTNHSAEQKFKPVKPQVTYDSAKNDSHMGDPNQHNTFVNASLNQSLAEKYRVSSAGSESNESRFKDFNQNIDEILSRLKTCLLEYQHDLRMKNIVLENPDLPIEYIEVAILKGEEILNNNKFMAKLDIDASGIKLAIDYFDTLNKKFQLNVIVLNCLNDLYEASFRKGKSLENFKSLSLKSTSSSKLNKFKVPRLNLEILANSNLDPQKKLNLYNDLMNKSPNIEAGSKSKSSRIVTGGVAINNQVKDWVAKKMTVGDYERMKIKFTSFVLICKEELPNGHAGKKYLVSDLFDEMLTKKIPEEYWFDFIQSKLSQEKGDTSLSSSPLCGGSRSNQECFF